MERSKTCAYTLCASVYPDTPKCSGWNGMVEESALAHIPHVQLRPPIMSRREREGNKEIALPLSSYSPRTSINMEEEEVQYPFQLGDGKGHYVTFSFVMADIILGMSAPMLRICVCHCVPQRQRKSNIILLQIILLFYERELCKKGKSTRYLYLAFPLHYLLHLRLSSRPPQTAFLPVGQDYHELAPAMQSWKAGRKAFSHAGGETHSGAAINGWTQRFYEYGWAT
ncbi:hypothetical protein BU17DRAFT_68085 [Hysterangium stoloniferum]|nr:hypothetical protein BU17DRAFT_68085 [Hysterangium stoloniferum]